MIQEHPHGHVEDTPELQAFYHDLEQRSTGALWTMLEGMMPDYPQPKAVPFLWQWDRIRPLLIRAGELVTPEKANRRVIVLCNPGLPGQGCASQTFQANVQMVLPGEIAPAHRHTAAAIRF